jgi:hypothetical protein
MKHEDDTAAGGKRTEPVIRTSCLDDCKAKAIETMMQ